MRMSQTQEINRLSEESQKLLVDITTQGSSNFARILQNFNVLIVILFSEIGIIQCSCGEI